MIHVIAITLLVFGYAVSNYSKEEQQQVGDVNIKWEQRQQR